MPNWTRTIRLQPEWDQAKAGEITRQVLAGVIADRIERLRPLNDEDLEETRQFLIEDFREMGTRSDLDADYFDEMMVNLYDWGDTRLDDHWNGKKVCWVDTTRIVAEAAA